MGLKELFGKRERSEAKMAESPVRAFVGFIKDGNYARLDYNIGENHIFQCRFPVDSIDFLPQIEDRIASAVTELIFKGLVPDRSLPPLETRRKKPKKNIKASRKEPEK